MVPLILGVLKPLYQGLGLGVSGYGSLQAAVEDIPVEVARTH